MLNDKSSRPVTSLVDDNFSVGSVSLPNQQNVPSVSSRADTSSLQDFRENGFVIVRKLFGTDEAETIQAAVKSDKTFGPHTDQQNFLGTTNSQLVVWNKALDSLWGSIARSSRVVDIMEYLLGFEVYHYHSKLSIKHPQSNARWCWHQDYGYWYEYGCLFPDLGSVMIALDDNTRENGCLKVISGSHKVGRLDHEFHNCFQSQVMPLDDPRQAKPSVKAPYSQSCADQVRVAALEKVMDVVHVELQPGDAVFFHCNLLHCSEENKTLDSPRWSLICCYNGVHNTPDRALARTMDHESYTPLYKVSDIKLKKILDSVRSPGD